MNRSEQWNNLLAIWVSRIRQWHSLAAIKLYEQLLLKNWNSSDSLFFYHLIDVAKQYPTEGCLILKQLLDQAVLPDKPKNWFMWESSFWNAFADTASGGLKIDEEILKALTEARPNEFLEAVWKFFERVLHVSALTNEGETKLHFPIDAFQDTWSIRNTRGVNAQTSFRFRFESRN